jgi:hypothetical protein
MVGPPALKLAQWEAPQINKTFMLTDEWLNRIAGKVAYAEFGIPGLNDRPHRFR